jgi:hypothetical protein
MVKKVTVPDAWDDDWENQADKAEELAEATANQEPVKISKAERLAQHEELNRRIWSQAEAPETFHYLAARETVPLKSEFKPQVTLLSRKPAPKIIARQDPVTGLSQMTIEDDDEDNREKTKQPTPEELRAKAQRDREEKQRKYDEVRARLFGTPTAGSASGSSSPGNVTPPREEGRNSRGKGKGRGRQNDTRRPDSQPGTRELYNPGSAPKPSNVAIQKRAVEQTRSGRNTPREDEVIRTPRGPDNGRGFGFANRGGKNG